MCSIAIPAELLLGHSPPVYGSLLYSSLMVTTPPIPNRSVPPQIRPCLASGSIQLNSLVKNSDENAATTNRRNKKKVVFADDRGRPLTQVRVMSEPSNMPPLWTSAYVARLARGNVFRNLDGSLSIQDLTDQSTSGSNGDSEAGSVKCADVNQWEASFPQPASDYLAFRAKLDENSVSLENVIVRESENCLIGTVKVKNLAYTKDVSIRVSSDNWQSYEDLPCVYVEAPGVATQTAVRNLYDTFRFRVPLPDKESNASQLEFCVHYKTEGAEFWDNNAGANYIVKRKREVTLEEQIAELLSACCGPIDTHNDFAQSPRRAEKDSEALPAEEATRMHLRTWSEFASWQHLDNDAPYW